MCLGIPGEVMELLDRPDLAKVNVSGVRRAINIGLLENENVQPGDWVLIHVGFALSKIDEDEAAAALASARPRTLFAADVLSEDSPNRSGSRCVPIRCPFVPRERRIPAPWLSEPIPGLPRRALRRTEGDGTCPSYVCRLRLAGPHSAGPRRETARSAMADTMGRSGA